VRQLALLTVSVDPSRWLRSRGFLCQRYGCTLTPAACVAAQTGARGPGTHCASGECAQGLRHLVEAGVIEKATCECCGGSGWVPRTRGGAPVRRPLDGGAAPRKRAKSRGE